MFLPLAYGLKSIKGYLNPPDPEPVSSAPIESSSENPEEENQRPKTEETTPLLSLVDHFLEKEKEILNTSSVFNMSLPKVKDQEKESVYGYVHAVSGPGNHCFFYITRISCVY